jgi:formylmethanofuran dehydrogenase subunit E
MNDTSSSIIDFDAITGRDLFPLGRMRCARCGDRAAVVVNEKLLCGDCFLERTSIAPPNPKEPGE